MKLEGKIKHGIALAIDHNDYVDCDVVYYGGMTIRLVNASYDDLSIAFGPVGSYVDMNAYYTKEEIDNKGYLTEHQDISGKADKVDTYTKAEADTLLDAKANASTTYTKSEVDTLISNVDIDIDNVPTSGSDHAVSSGGVYDSLENKQNTLVSGTNIKTINGVSVLGSGDIDADDVVVGKLENDKFYTVTISGLGTKTFSSTPVTGNYNKLYADILTFKLYWYDPKIIQFGSDDVHYKLIGGVDETDPIFTTSAAYGITATDIANWNAKVNSSDLASVATSGSYNDLSDKPDIPQAQVQSDWNESDSSKVDYIKNKPTIPTVPTNVSAFTNDVGYLTQHQSLADYYTKTEVDTVLGGKADSADLASVATSGSYNDLSNKPTIPTVPSNVSAFNNDAGYLTMESDPTVPNHVKSITQQNITNWNNKADVFTINCVYNGTSITSCDKTFAEISSAHNSGKILNVVINNGYAFGRLNQVNGSAFYFNVVDTVDDHIIASYELEINSNNTCNITLASINIANYYTKSEVNSALDDKQDTIADLATIRSGAALGATAYQKPNGGIPKSDLASSVQTSLGLADSALQQHQDLSSLADGAEYDSSAKKIYLKHGNTRLGNPIDATAFIKDGMIDTVTVTNGNLVISFNTDAGKQPISLPISDIFNANNYYTKTEIDNKGYLTSETDPVFGASVAAGIKSTDIASWNAKQSAIADLDDIRTGASLGATALQSYTETDPTVPSWAKQPNKPTYTASEVGALPSTTQIPSKTSDLTNDSGFITGYTETDPTVPAWAKASSKPTYTASEVGALPDNTVIPSKTSDLTNDSGFVTGCKVYYGTCTTEAATNPKVVTVETFPTDENDKPLVGTLICVKYSYTDTSTSTSPTINVNNTGDERIWVNNAVLGSAKSAYHGYANRYISYMWDGTYWVWFSWGYDSNTTYTNVALGQGYATQNNSAAASAVTAALSSYTLTVGGIVSVKFTYDVPASATLNVNSKGAKAIYHRGAAIAAGVIKAGDTATFIYSTYYHLISVDRSDGADLTNYYTKTEIDTKIGNIETLLSNI